MPRSRSLVAALAVAGVLLAGCSDGDLEQQARAGDDKGYVTGKGFTELSPDQRGDPVDVTGTTAEGESLALADLRGEVVVLNVWYAACGPCRAEAEDLQAVAEETAAEGVRFVGINTRDDAATAQAFQRRFGITYPTIMDADGSAIVALRGEVSPQAVPTTLVVDRQGRVAARVLGVVEPSVLRTLVADAVAAT